MTKSKAICVPCLDEILAIRGPLTRQDHAQHDGPCNVLHSVCELPGCKRLTDGQRIKV